ncbi:MAG: hypothetical protein ACFE7E_01970 [Candidatus Hodarchaeota archaeon]
MEKREILMQGIRLVADPISLKMTPSTFLADYGGYTEEVAVVAKHETGYALYPSQEVPVHNQFGSFFSKFTEISKDILKVNAVINTFTDSYMGKDPKFASIRSGGTPNEDFMCPTHEKSWDYLASAGREVANYPVEGIILVGNTFVQKDFCFCNNCKNEFGQIGSIQSDFNYDRISLDPELHSKWSEWRSDKLTTGLIRIVDAIHSVNSDLDVSIEVYLDPETDFAKGAEEAYAQNIERLAKEAKNLTLNVFPWTPLLPTPGSEEFGAVIRQLEFTKELIRRQGVRLSLLHWRIDDETDLNSLKSMAKEINAERILAYADYPSSYRFWREAHLGIT